MASDLVPYLSNIMDFTDFAGDHRGVVAIKKSVTNHMSWDMHAVLLHEEIPEGRTCLFSPKSGEKIVASMLCLRNGLHH
eukprot:15801532-Heterocapsa_arctica.AAC.1